MNTIEPKDRHLSVPAEANRDKHINFKALENNDPDPADQRKKRKFWQIGKQRDKTGKQKNR